MGGATLGWPNTLSPHDSGLAIEGVWPSLFFGSERVGEMRRKIETLDWARAASDQWRAEAETILPAPPQLPIEPIGWRHDFYSPATAEHLVFDPRTPDRYVDPWDGAVYGPESASSHVKERARRKAWTLFAHERTYRLMHALGTLYALTGDERYARWVVDGVRGAVEMFRRSDFRELYPRKALYFQPLYDAQILLLLATAYDLTRRSAAYTGADHEAIRSDVFESAVPYQVAFLDSRAPQNMFAYVDAALAVAGDVFARADWRSAAYDHPRAGLSALLEYALRRDSRGRYDGFWVEGTQFYHLYSVCPLVALVDRLRPDGGPADARDRLAALLAAPARMADDRLRLPAFGDLGAPRVLSLRAYRHLYEYAAGQLDAERFRPALTACYAGGIPRTSLAALAYGLDEAGTPAHTANRTRSAAPLAQRVWRSDTFRTMGISFLRGVDRDMGERYQFWLRAAAHGEGHDHPDKLSIGLHAAGEVILTDLGTAGYGLAEHTDYCRSTFSHNTLLVDEQPQARVKTAALRTGRDWAAGTVLDAYPGVRLERRVRLVPPHVVIEDVFEAEGEQANHRYAAVFHIYGPLSVHAVEAGSDLAPLPADGVWSWFTNRRGGLSDGADSAVVADWRIRDGLWCRLTAECDAPLEWTAGQTPGNPVPDRRGTLVLRTRGTPGARRRPGPLHRQAF